MPAEIYQKKIQNLAGIMDPTGNLTGDPLDWPMYFNPGGYYHHQMTHPPANDPGIPNSESNP